MDIVGGLLGIIAFIMVFRARREIADLAGKLAQVGDELRQLRTEVALRRAAGPAPDAAPPATAPAPAPPQAPLSAPPVAPVQPPPAAVPVTPSRPEPASATAAPAGPRASLEERLGTRWAVWVGGLALALGGILLVRYSIEQGVFGPGVRVALGGLFALALIVAGEWFRRAERSAAAALPSAHIPSILTAAGTASAFATVYAAHALYGFVGPAAAFVLLGLIGVATMFAAALHGPALAGLGLAGSFVVPLLVSSDAPNPWALVLYLAAVAAAAFALARLRRWLWLAAATVAGAVLWGFVMLDQAHGLAGLPWIAALFAHAAVQLALAAVFMALEPHLSTPDEAAAPDWIAAAALAALTALAVVALGAARFDAQWTVFAVVATAVLALTAWRSAPAAAAAPLAGSVALGAVATWPGLSVPPDASLLAPALAGVLRLPENVSNYLAFSAALTLAAAIIATLRLWRGPALPMLTAGLYALGAVVPPLLALILVYLRVTQFDRSISFAVAAVVLAALFYVVADRADNARLKTPVTHFMTGAFAAGTTAAMALAFTMALDRGYLTVAFAVTALTTSIFAVVDRIPLLRYVVVAIGVIVLGRLVWDPAIMGDGVGTWPVFNWLLLGYGAPAVAFLAAGRILARERDDLAVRLCDGLGILFAGLLVFYEIHHALNGGDPLSRQSGHVEQGLFALTSLGFSYVLMRLDLGRANVVYRAASMLFGALAAFLIVMGLGLAENPLLSGDRVLGPPVLSSLALAYLLPGLAAVVVARAARGVRPGWYVTGAGLLALFLIFGYVTLEVRHVFHGPHLSILSPAGNAEVWTYSVAWLGLGLLMLAYGVWRGSREARLASAALVVASVLKVFLYDLSGITGLWRALSFICLGAVLIGIGLVYQKLIFARPRPDEPQGGASG